MAMPPNVIFCMCDELRWCEVNCYGHPTIRTPHIDRIAREGVRFDVGISNVPVCLPARSVVLSGQYARSCCGMTSNVVFAGGSKFSDVGFPQWPTGRRRHLPDPTLPELLHEHGYTTAAIGKWHIDAWPDAVGFDHYIIPSHHHAHSAQHFCRNGAEVYAPQGYSVDHEVDCVRDYLRERAQPGIADPFFLYYNISPPHMPLADAPDKYQKMYGRDDVVVRDNVDPGQMLPDQMQKFLTYLWDYRYYRDKLPHTQRLPSSDFDLVDLTAMYMGLVTWVDDAVGQMVAELEAVGLMDNTIIVFCSDHGDNLGSWGRMGKGLWRDESSRIPMLVCGPGIAKSVVTRQIGSLVDWAPTLLELVGGEVPQHMQGQSLASVVRGDEQSLDHNYAIIEAPEQGIAVRTPDMLCGIPWTNGDPWTLNRPIASEASEIFDLAVDPYALNNLQGREHFNGEIKQMEQLIHEFDQRVPWRECK